MPRELIILVEVAAIAVMAWPTFADAQERIVLDALPVTSVSSSRDGSDLDVLDPTEREESRLLIVERNGSYFWSTREDRELVYLPPRTGFYHQFIAPGGGYVKVLDQTGTPVESPLRLEGADIQFFEHVSFLLTTVTYWGEAEQFDPVGLDVRGSADEVVFDCVSAGGTLAAVFRLDIAAERASVLSETLPFGDLRDSGSVHMTERGSYVITIPHRISGATEFTINPRNGRGRVVTFDESGLEANSLYSFTCERIDPQQ